MQNLIAFLTKYFHWLVFIILEIVSGVLLFNHNSYQGSVWFSSANAVTGKIYEWESGVQQFFRLKERAQQLALRNVRLENQLAALREELRRVQADTAAIDSSTEQALSHLTVVPAKVVSSTLHRADNLITIDRGRADGIEPDMGVTCGTGLVGVVYMASEHYAVVLPLLNTHSRISCAIRNRGYFGYLAWDGHDATTAYMEDIPRHAQFEKGEWVETSGFSAIFPPGISVGRITDIGNSADGLSYRLRIELSTDFGCLRDVCVITDKGFAERQRLQVAARDSMALAQ